MICKDTHFKHLALLPFPIVWKLQVQDIFLEYSRWILIKTQLSRYSKSLLGLTLVVTNAHMARYIIKWFNRRFRTISITTNSIFSAAVSFLRTLVAIVTGTTLTTAMRPATYVSNNPFIALIFRNTTPVLKSIPKFSAILTDFELKF